MPASGPEKKGKAKQVAAGTVAEADEGGIIPA